MELTGSIRGVNAATSVPRFPQQDGDLPVVIALSIVWDKLQDSEDLSSQAVHATDP